MGATSNPLPKRIVVHGNCVDCGRPLAAVGGFASAICREIEQTIGAGEHAAAIGAAG